MSPDLERLADEAIELRANDAAGQLIRHRIDGEDSIARFLELRTQAWDKARPDHALLADQRLAALARLAADGIHPDNGCTATSGQITLEAVRDLAPVAHRYRIVRLSRHGQPTIGVAWLTPERGNGLPYYIAQIDRTLTYGETITEALQRAVNVLADTERRDRQAVR